MASDQKPKRSEGGEPKAKQPDAPELLPCPFCGEGVDDAMFTHSTEDREGIPVAMSCHSCGAIGPWIYTEPGTFPYETIAAWNRRADLAQQSELKPQAQAAPRVELTPCARRIIESYANTDEPLISQEDRQSMRDLLALADEHPVTHKLSCSVRRGGECICGARGDDDASV